MAKKKAKGEPAGAEASPPEDLGVICATEAKKGRVTFDWPGMFLRGALNCIDGAKGTGKSSILANLAASMCSGKRLPESKSSGPKGACLWIGSEEDFGSAIAERWKVNGGDPRQLLTVDSRAVDGPGRMSLPYDEDRLRLIVQRHTVRAIVADPFTALACPTMDPCNNHLTRLYLESLGRVASEYGATVLLARHLTKSRSGSLLNQGMGGVAIAATCRSVLRVERSPSDPSTCYLACIAGNHGTAPGVVPYSLEERAGFVFAAKFKARQAMAIEEVIEGDEEADEKTAMDDCLTLLKTSLKGGPVDAKVILEEANRNGMGVRTLRKAQKKLGVRTKRIGGGKGLPGKWQWFLPAK